MWISRGKGCVYHGGTAGREDGLIAWWTVGDLGGTIRSSFTAEVEFLANGVHLEVVDGRGGTDGHDAEVGVGLWLTGRRGGGQEGEWKDEGGSEFHGGC